MGKVIRLFPDPERVVDIAVLRRLRRQREIRRRLAERRLRRENKDV